MAREQIDLYNIDTLPENLRTALLDLRLDYDAHNHDGASSSSIQTLSVETLNARVFSIRKSSFSSTISGIWMGLEGNIVKMNIGDASRSIQYDGSNLTIKGDLTAGSLNINSGVASIDSDGAAVFKSIRIGGATTQYIVSNDGLFSFGDGSDGALVTSGDVTLTTDKYYTNLTISDGDTFDPAGYRVFVSGTLTVGEGSSGIIERNGTDGNAAVTTTIGTGATGLADGYLKGSADGGDGGQGESTSGPSNKTAGDAGAATTNSIGSSGVAGGAGGTGGTGGAAGGGGGGATASNVKLIANWHLATLLDVGSTGATIKFDNSGGGGGGGGGGWGTSPNPHDAGAGGSGGGGASSGGIVAIYAREIILNSGSVIQALGGTGGAGGAGGDSTGSIWPNPNGGGGGGGGAGGNGGQIILVYNSLTNNGSIVVTGGTGGVGGAGGAGKGTGSDGTDGTTGTTGTTGTIRQFAISL